MTPIQKRPDRIELLPTMAENFLLLGDFRDHEHAVAVRAVEALKALHLHKSSDPSFSDDMAWSAPERLRREAKRIESQDEAVDNARKALRDIEASGWKP